MSKCEKCNIILTKENEEPYVDMCKSCWENKCDRCAYDSEYGCQCETFMAAGCIPTYETTLEEILGFERVIK